MILLSGFLEVLFRGLIFVGLALGVGGIAFRFIVLGPSAASHALASVRRTSSIIALGAFLVFVSQLFSLIVAPWALADETGRWPLALFLSTRFARAGLVRAILALCMGVSALLTTRSSYSRISWVACIVFGAMVLVSGAWLGHGASRLEDSGVLMSVTVIHQLATVTWIGGTLHLIAQWRLLRNHHAKRTLWPELPARFTPVALASVGVLMGAGYFLSVHYVGNVDRLVGTAYGTMLLTKIALMVVALALGGSNFLLLRRLKHPGGSVAALERVPTLIETEAAIGVIILMAAAAFTGQPPAIDTIAQSASPAEVVHVFAPKRLQLLPAPMTELNANKFAAIDPFAKSTVLDRIQSNFNHNVSGGFVLLIGFGALVHRLMRARFARHWPLLFLPFWLFLVLFAQPTGWPLGSKGFWESLVSAEVLQHRMGTLLVAAIGFFEWRVQLGKTSEAWRKAFPLLCLLGGMLLLSHSHSLQAEKSAFLIEVSHNALGVLAVLVGALSWIELRSTGRVARAAGVLWPLCLMGVGGVLLLYQEVSN